MAVIFQDGATTYDSATTATLVKGWAITGTAPSYRQSGAWGTGSYCFVTGLETASRYVLQTLPSQTTYTLGFRWQLGHAGTQTDNTSLAFAQLGPVQFFWTSNDTFVVYVSGTLLYTSGTYSLNVWNYLEVQVTASTSVGVVTIWENGAQTYHGTGLNLLGSSISTFTLGNNTSTRTSTFTTNLSVTDIYVTDTTNASGAGNTGNLGPIRVETLSPSGAGSNTTWTSVVGTNVATTNQFNPATTTGFVADTAIAVGQAAFPYALSSPWDAFGLTGVITGTPSGTGAIMTTTTGTGGYAVTVGTAYTASVLLSGNSASGNFSVGIRWYTSGGAIIQTDLGTSTSVSAGNWVALYLNGTAPATAAFAALVVENIGAGNTTAYYATGFTFIPTPTTVVWSGAIIKSPALGSANWGNVAEGVADQDNTFNRDPGASTNVGDMDTYTMAALASTSGIPLAVSVTDIAMKENTNPRSVAPVIRISSTNYAGSSQGLNNDTAYHAYGNVWETNPATGSTWKINDITPLQPTLRATAAVGSVFGGGWGGAITIPSSVVPGDLMIAVFTSTSSGTTPPSGWNTVLAEIVSTASGGQNFPVHMTIWSRVAQIGDAGSTFTWSILGNGALILAAYYNCSSTTPIYMVSSAVAVAQATSFNAPTITTTRSHNIILEIFGSVREDAFNATQALTGPATVETSFSCTSLNAEGLLSDQIQSSPGSAGGGTCTAPVNSVWVAATLALSGGLFEIGTEVSA